MQKGTVQKLATVGLLVALEIVFSRFLSFSTFNLKIGFGFVPVVIAAMLYGPVYGGITAALADFLGANLFPIGAYFPGFTFTAFLMGAVYGIFLHKKVNIGRVLLAVGIVRFALSLGLNTLWISILSGKGYVALLPLRLLQEGIMVPVQVLLIMLIGQKLPSLLKRKAYGKNG